MKQSPLHQQLLRSLAETNGGRPCLEVTPRNPILSWQDNLFADSERRCADILNRKDKR